MSVRDLIIIGAGPSGLSAAIAAKRRGLDYQVLEQGVLVNSIYRFPPHLVFFTTPELLEIGGLPFVSPYDKPTRIEALKYYRKVVDTYNLQITYEEKVLSIAREPSETHEGADLPGTRAVAAGLAEAGPEDATDAEDREDLGIFAVETRSARGVRRVRHARTIVLAIGYYDHANMLNIPGEELSHVQHYYNEPHAYYRQRVLIVGGGNSAAEAALELFRAGAHVTLVHRADKLKPTIKYWVRPDIENRIKAGSVAARFNTRVVEIRPTTVLLRADGGAAEAARIETPDLAVSLGWPAVGERESSQSAATPTVAKAADINMVPDAAVVGSAGSPENAGSATRDEELPADAVFLLTGYRADSDLMIRAGIRLNERHAPVFDPHTFETNVPGLFVAGGAIAGIDTGTIFIENGRFHGEKIVDVIARRFERRQGT